MLFFGKLNIKYLLGIGKLEMKTDGKFLRGDCKPYPHNVKLVNF